MALPLIGHASIGEDGTAKANKAGDQTKGEVCTRKWYEHRKGWGYILRPKDKKVAEAMANAWKMLARMIVSDMTKMID